ncbi:hypothetical protein F0562_014068 [Nyssa sinensis]|uniref:Leucine-rich repeat-containing N-terminal plant-type domain-containing protein n=1 Tax=Nyssa sinensis TaxID=561372 RepID=A0A5J4ZQX3_9ASTE|nr:hypothetical protein F0562_014068 [Nyssa sinensis]
MYSLSCLNWEIYVRILTGLMAIFASPICHGFTDPRDVFAINSLYGALGFPPLPGWVPIGGDPCAEGWQGVLCVNANITAIVLSGMNLGGELGNNLESFASIIQLELSNNHIGGTIPSNLPVTIRSFFLSGNQFTGSIPDTLSSLDQLTDMLFSDNHLTGEIPDAFQQLAGLINLDLSGNNFSGQLPPSMGNISSLTTLHLQNNQLTGTLNVLQDLPLSDLNVENNLFSGPIPDKLLSIPNFRRDGNPFNTTIIPAPPAMPPAIPPSPSSSRAPSPEVTLGTRTNGPSVSEIPNSARGGNVLTRRQSTDKLSVRHEMGAHNDPKEKPRHNEFLLKPYNYTEKVPKEAVSRPAVGYGMDSGTSSIRLKPEAEQETYFKRVAAISKHREDHEIDMTGMDVNILQPPPSPPTTLLPVDKVNVNPIVPPKTTRVYSTKCLNSVRPFTIASLQQYTNSFSQENLIGGGLLGTVYRAELPSGKLLAVKKLGTAACQAAE